MADHEDRELGDVLDRPAEPLDRRTDVPERLLGLLDDVLADELPFGIEADLTADEDDAGPAPDRELGVHRRLVETVWIDEFDRHGQSLGTPVRQRRVLLPVEDAQRPGRLLGDGPPALDLRVIRARPPLEPAPGLLH